MKNYSKNLVLALVAVASTTLIAACGDGNAAKAPAPLPSESCIATISAVKAGDSEAMPVTGDLAIEDGESVVLSWTVSPVTAATLTSEPSAVVGQEIKLALTPLNKDDKIDEAAGIIPPSESVGEMEFRALKNDATFTVSGTNAEKGKEATTCKASISVVIMPARAEVKIDKFEALTPEVEVNQPATLCWQVSGSDVAVSVSDEDGEVIEGSSEAEGSVEESGAVEAAKAMLGAKSQESLETSALETDACTEVKPTKTTTYTLTAVAKDGRIATTRVTVRVKAPEIKADIFANNIPENLIVTQPGEVELSWNVTPADAVVTIDGIGKVASIGSQKVTVTDDVTTFRITATYDDKVVTKDVRVVIQRNAASLYMLNLASSAAGSVFAGETVKLSWNLTSGEGAATAPEGAKFFIDGPEGRVEVSGNSAEFAPKAAGTYVVRMLSSNGEVVSNQVKINIRNWQIHDLGSSWGSIAAADKNNVVTGALTGAVGGVKFANLSGRKTLTSSSLDFGASYASLFFANMNTSKLSVFGDLNLNNISLDKATGRLYASMTGMAAYSDNKGKSWKPVDVFHVLGSMVKNDKDFLEYKGCKGAARKGASNKKMEMIALHDVCDAEAIGERLLVATNWGVYYKDNINTFMTDRKSRDKDRCWVGNPYVAKCKKVETALTGTTVNVLESFGGAVFAGTEKGVFVTRDNGETWSESNGGDMDSSTVVYALTIDAAGKAIYAAGPNGVFVAELGGVTWKKLGDAAGATVAYSVTIDPTVASTLYVGTDAGAFISRDAGATWAPISSSMNSVGPVYGVTAVESGAGTAVYAATADGLYSSFSTTIVNELVGGVSPAQPEIPETTPETPVIEEPVTTPTDPDTVAADAMKSML